MLAPWQQQHTCIAHLQKPAHSHLVSSHPRLRRTPAELPGTVHTLAPLGSTQPQTCIAHLQKPRTLTPSGSRL